MKVFVLLEQDWEGTHFEGLFTTRELAFEKAKILDRKATLRTRDLRLDNNGDVSLYQNGEPFAGPIYTILEEDVQGYYGDLHL